MTYDEKMTVFMLHLEGYINKAIVKMLLNLKERDYESMKKSANLFVLHKIKSQKLRDKNSDVLFNNFYHYKAVRCANYEN